MDGDCKAKLAAGTVVEIEAGASLFTDPISDVYKKDKNSHKRRNFATDVRNQIELRSELSDLSGDNNAANKTYESRILEGESSSDEGDEEKHGNI
ncbi:hypothetical protein TNCV_5006301 [Trichonephila clavipes]|uniref:Uncharacterized protein n=1 Tax=Trichonephila clavipes TaxID=2585209 RepID=A0A8X6S766_TRICX|nr:hypothetical protein TNCV_5006301 [Trichonephila clavipes]